MGQEAKESERNLVMCETKDWEDAELKFPICALNLGKSETVCLVLISEFFLSFRLHLAKVRLLLEEI